MRANHRGVSGFPSKMHSHRVRSGLLLGLLGVLIFSVTLPATKLAVAELGVIVVGLGRALVAAALAALVLVLRRERLPERRFVRGFIVCGAGLVVGFPILSALALRSVPAVHSAIIVGFMPIATAIFAVVSARERPPRLFWAGTILGALVVVAFAVLEGDGAPQPADAFLLLAVAAGGLGYAQGALIAREIGGWRVVCWMLVFSAPFLVIPVVLAALHNGLRADAAAWLGFAYVSIFSMFVGFFPWYAGLVRGGIARVGQVQLLQPFLTIGWGGLLLHEHASPRTLMCALLIVACITLTQRGRRPARAEVAA